MQKKLFSIRDAKGEIYNMPFAQLTHGEAERSLSQLANDPKTQIAQYPEDYDLFYLGTFDDVSGKLETLQTPQHVVKALNLVKAQPGTLNAVT